MKKRLLSWLLVLTMIVSLLPSATLSALAASSGVSLPSSYTEEIDVSTLTANKTITGGGTYKLTGTCTTGDRQIIVNTASSVTLVLDGVTLSGQASPIELQGKANVTLVLPDGKANKVTCTATAIRSDSKTAGILVPENATLTITKVADGTGTGSLTVQGGYGGAGIGGGNGYGTTSETGAAGANGADGNAGGSYTQTETGTTVSGGKGGTGGKGAATGGKFGADGQNAGTVVIHAGVVTITGGNSAPGIGGGLGANGEPGNAGSSGQSNAQKNSQRYLTFTDGRGYNVWSGAGGGSAGGNGSNGGDGGTGGSLKAVSITGGTVTVTGGENAVGIGGGTGGQGGVGGAGGAGGAGAKGGNNSTGGNGAQGSSGYTGYSPGGDGGLLSITGGEVDITGYAAVGFGHCTAPADPKINYGIPGSWNNWCYSGSGANSCLNTAPTHDPADTILTIIGGSVTLTDTATDKASQYTSPNEYTRARNEVWKQNSSSEKEPVYKLDVTVKAGSESGPVVPNANIEIPVYPKGNVGIAYIYYAQTDENGVAHIWLPEDEYPLSGSDIWHREEGKILGEQNVSNSGADTGACTIVLNDIPFTNGEVEVSGIVRGSNGTENTTLWAMTLTFPERITESDIVAIKMPGYMIDEVEIEKANGDKTTESRVDYFYHLTNIHGTDTDFAQAKVTFIYVDNMADLTVRCTYNGKEIGGYNTRMEKWTPQTLNAPSIDGYTPTKNNTTFTLTKDDRVTFEYTKNTGNVILKVKDKADSTILYSGDGGTVAKDSAIQPTSLTQPPTIDFYQKVGNPEITMNGSTVNAGTTYNGKGDIVVTYTYERATQDLKVLKVDADTQQNIGTETIPALATGRKVELAQHAITTPKDYTPLAGNPTSVVLANEADQSVTLFYKKNTTQAEAAAVTVKLKLDGTVFETYTVDAVKGQEITIAAPTLNAYELKAPAEASKKITPKGNADQDVVEFDYTIKSPRKVTVKLVNKKDNSDLQAPEGFPTEHTLKIGDTLELWAPAMNGYSLSGSKLGTTAQNNAWRVSVNYDAITNSTETVTFEYEPAAASLITVNVVGKTTENPARELYKYAQSVASDTPSVQVFVSAIPGYVLSSAKVDNVEKKTEVTNNSLTVDLSPDKQTVDVVILYEDNMTDLTVLCTYNNTTLQTHKVRVEKNVETTIQAPLIEGYTATRTSADKVKATGNATSDKVTFAYTKNTGNLTIVAKEKDTDLALWWEGGDPVNKGDKIDLNGANNAQFAAPTIDFYERLTNEVTIKINGTEVAKDNATYNGLGDIEITYYYQRKTASLTVELWDDETGKKIPSAADVTLSNLPMGKEYSFQTSDVTTPTGYNPVAEKNPTSVYIKDEAGQTVKFWFRNTSQDQYVQVLVKLMDATDAANETLIITIPQTAKKGVQTTIQAPQWTGYTLKTGEASSQTITPTGNGDEVSFKYTIKDPRKVNIKLTNSADSSALTAPAGYTTAYTLKEGDSLTLTAPSLNGYTLISAALGGTAQNDPQVVTLRYEDLTQESTDLTFTYSPVDLANFVTHTIKFMVGNQLLYSHEKLVSKGTGTQVTYTNNVAQDIIPGYAFDKITYQVSGAEATADKVTDAVNATILFYFVEDAVTITIKKVDEQNQPLPNVADTVLTGYRKGQTNVVVAAPVVEGYALVGDTTKTVNLTAANTDVTFQYAPAGKVTFTLTERQADGGSSIIKIINGVAGESYDPAVTGNPLDLTKDGYTFVRDADASDPFKEGGAGKVENLDESQSASYVVYYTKQTRTVEFVPVNKTLLDKAGKTLDDVIADNTVDTYKITTVTPAVPEAARVGESYKAVAQSFNGWSLKDAITKLYTVEVSTEPLKVCFLYEEKAQGSVSVRCYYGTTAADGVLLHEYTVEAAVGEKLTVNAPASWEGGKYTLSAVQTTPTPHTLTATESPIVVDFFYEANYYTVRVQTVENGGSPVQHSTHEIIKGQSLTLYPPIKTGFALAGVKVEGNTVSGGESAFPAGWQASENKLLLIPDGESTVTLYYFQDTSAPKTVNVRLVNGADQSALTPPTDYAVSHTLRKGESVSITAPALTGYNLTGATLDGTAQSSAAVVRVSYDALTADSATVTFTYTVVSTGGGGGGGGGVTTYTIKASAGAGGSISPSGNVTVRYGSDKAFTFTPDAGYVVKDIVVDGVSQGPDSAYIFTQVKTNHTISVSFTPARPIGPNGVADPDETGVSSWLRTTDHSAYMNGYDTGLFGPRDNLTRAQAAQLFYNLLVDKSVSVTVFFNDVPESAWYAKAVNTLASLGVLNGVGAGRFDPERSITRAEFTALATRFAKVSHEVTASPFDDVSRTDWYFQSVLTAVSYGWIDGYGNGLFGPLDNITRAEAATIVNRMLARRADESFLSQSGEVRGFADVTSGDWFYLQVMEAANGHDFHYDVDGYETWTKLKK